MNKDNGQITGRNQQLYLLWIILIASFFIPFLGAAVNIALPHIGKDLNMTANGLSWVAMSFLLSSALFMVPFGKLADTYGRKKYFMWGIFIMSLSSILCAFSIHPAMLISARLIQGIGSAMVFCTSMALITSAFPPAQRGRYIGYVVSSVYIGLTAAPFLGGLLTFHLGWKSIFLIQAATGFFIVVALAIKVKAEWYEKQGGKFDILGMLLYMAPVFLFMFGLSKIPEYYSWWMIGVSIPGFVFFVFIEKRKKNPVFDIHLFSSNKLFAFSNIAALINYAVTFAVTFVLSLYLQYIKGFSPQHAGYILMIQPAIMATGASFSGRMSDKYNPGLLASAGMAIIVIGLVLLLFLGPNTQIIYIGMTLIVLGLGFGLFSSPNTNAIMGAVEKRHLGTASATVSTMRLLGQLLSMAIAGMAINFYIGQAKIEKSNHHLFIKSIHIIFIVFVVLSVFGVFFSLSRGKKQD